MGLIEQVSGRKVALDTAVFIYFLEEHVDYLPIVKPIFEAADRQQLQLYTSVISLLEVLVVPYRQNRQDLLMAYQTILENHPAITLIPVNAHLAQVAAQLRAKYSVRTPDALQVASAIVSGADVFVTNDLRLKAINEVSVKLLKDDLT